MKQFIQLVLYSLLLITIIHFVFPKLEILHLIIYSINITSFYQLVQNIGKKIIFPEFLSFTAITLWLTVPIIIWDLNIDKLAIPNLFASEILEIDKTIYYKWAIPATLAMVLGLNLNSISTKNLIKYFNNTQEHIRKIDSNIPKILFSIGAFSLLMGEYLPSGFGFVFFLLSQLTFISVLYCIYGEFKFAKWIYIGTALISLKGVASGGMFGELVWWGLIIAIYALIKFQWSFIKKLLLISIGIFLINILQIVKGEYRKLTWYSKYSEGPSLKLLGNTLLNSTFDAKTSKTNAASYALMYRLNHAYTVSRVMKYVPKKEPFAKGETIFGSLFASFIPRLFWPNKPTSGGKENMSRFANFTPHGGASYDIGQIGDAWANFGYWGGIVFLFIYGFFNSWLLKGLIEFGARSYPSIILWIPIVFLQLLKVEVSVVTNFNAAIKGAFFIVLIFWSLKKIGIKL